MKRVRILLFTALLFFACTSPAHSQASSAGTLPAVSNKRMGTLGGHEFVPSSYVQYPFVRTFLRTGLGAGLTPELVVPIVTIGDTSIVGLQGSLLYAVLDVEYQQTIRDWLAIRGRVRVTGRMANETPALISQGVTLFSAFDLGWLFRMYQSERLSLSGSLNVRSASTTDVYLQRYIEGIRENGEIMPGSKLVQTTPTMSGGVGLHAAYTISDLVGLTFGGQLEYGESVDRNSPDEWVHDLAVALDFNLVQSSGVPVGFVIGVNTRSVPHGAQAAGGKTAQTFFGRIGYIGSQEFSIGIDLGYDLTPVRNQENKQGFISVLIDTRLYF